MPDARQEPVRTCVACRQEAAKWALVRFVRDTAGALIEDPTRRAPGRGAYLHDDPACRALALKKRSLERALRLRNTQTGDNP